MTLKIHRYIAAAILAGPTGPAFAQYCDFEATRGTLVQFEAQPSYVTALHRFPDRHSTVPAEEFGGKKARIAPPTRVSYGSYVYEVVLEDCGTIYLKDTDGRLTGLDESLADFKYLEQPPTTWNSHVRVDPMTDERTCSVTPEADQPYPMFHYGRHATTVGVVGGDFPGKPVRFRLDKNPPLAEVEGLGTARTQALVSQIRKGGKKLLVGAYEWPYEYEKINEFNIAGLVEALDECKAAVR